MADVVEFAFSLGQPVRFAGAGPGSDALEPVVKGQLHDARGRHYQVLHQVNGTPRLAWFSESQISRKPD